MSRKPTLENEDEDLGAPPTRTMSDSKIALFIDFENIAIGVIDAWLPQPKFYDLNNDAFDLPENLYLPWGWAEALKIPSGGNTNCVRRNTQANTFDQLLVADCVWLQYWAELPTASFCSTTCHRYLRATTTPRSRWPSASRICR